MELSEREVPGTLAAQHRRPGERQRDSASGFRSGWSGRVAGTVARLAAPGRGAAGPGIVVRAHRAARRAEDLAV